MRIKSVVKTVALAFLFFSGFYLLLPSPRFPEPPSGALRSGEPGDMESIYRRAYFTNYSRSEILNYYQRQFQLPGQFLLNYPPEEAFALIRDQTNPPGSRKLSIPGANPFLSTVFIPLCPPSKLILTVSTT